MPTVTGSAFLRASPALQATEDVPGGLWLAYQGLRVTAQDLWQQWRMIRSVSRTDGTSGFVYGKAYEADQAADQAYAAYLAALRAAHGAAG